MYRQKRLVARSWEEERMRVIANGYEVSLGNVKCLIIKTTELYTSKWQVLWHVSCISVKLLKMDDSVYTFKLRVSVASIDRILTLCQVLAKCLAYSISPHHQP